MKKPLISRAYRIKSYHDKQVKSMARKTHESESGVIRMCIELCYGYGLLDKKSKDMVKL